MISLEGALVTFQVLWLETPRKTENGLSPLRAFTDLAAADTKNRFRRDPRSR